MIVAGFFIALVVLGFVGMKAYFAYSVNPRIATELSENSEGGRAEKVILLRFPDGLEIPVNDFREGGQVFVGAGGGLFAPAT